MSNKSNLLGRSIQESRVGPDQNNVVTYKDIVVQQSMIFASTDDLVSEIEKRLYGEDDQLTGLEKFDTEGEAYMSLHAGFIAPGSWERHVLERVTDVTGSTNP